MFFMLQRKREMMQKNDSLGYTVLHAVGIQHSPHTYAHTSSCTPITSAPFLSNKTLTVKHGQFSFTDSYVVHNKTHSQSSWTEG